MGTRAAGRNPAETNVTVTGALDGGAADYLIKPFELEQLKAKLAALFGGAGAPPP